jgi:SpoVK/Ycf46/Vps4 family AAA+-type ATPase
VLFFDEADALFGARTTPRDAQDRYANLEVAYLLQRIELFSGLAILATNMKDSIDPAFLRRFRFVVDFPFPEEAERLSIWRHAFPADAPVDGIRHDRLARLAVPGGTIRNIALHAAFRAAEHGGPIGMADVLAAARDECARIGRPLLAHETEAWL